MRLLLFLILGFAHLCMAGPLIVGIGAMIGRIAGEAAKIAFGASSMARAFGVGNCAVWFGRYVVVDGTLYYGSTLAGVGTLAAGAGTGGLIKATQEQEEEFKSLSLASVASVASISSSRSAWSASKSSLRADLSTSAAVARASADALFKEIENQSYDTAKGPFNFNTIGVRSAPAATTSKPVSSTLGAPPGTPVSTLAPDSARPPEVPPGVPDYVFRMCQYDIIAMGTANESITFDQPAPQSILVGNIPATCMTLSQVMLGDPDLGPHPYPMGSDSLQYDDVDPELISLIRQAFGVDPIDVKP